MNRERMLALAIVSTLSLHARAGEPSASDRETARTLLDEAEARFEKGNIQQALKLYQQADALVHVPTTGAELAKAQAAASQLVEAKETCRRVIAFPRSVPEPPVFGQARSRCEALMEGISTRIPSVTFRLKGLPPELVPSVTLDREEVKATASEFRRKVNPGPHHIVVNASGFATVERDFTLVEKETTDVVIAMQPAPTATEARAPAIAAPVAPSPRSMPSVGVAATVREPIPTYVWIAWGVGGAALATGTLTGAMSLSRLSDAKRNCVGTSCTEAARSDLNATRTLETVANVSFALSLVGAGVGLYGFLARGAVAKETAGAEPYVNFGGAGVSGRF